MECLSYFCSSCPVCCPVLDFSVEPLHLPICDPCSLQTQFLTGSILFTPILNPHINPHIKTKVLIPLSTWNNFYFIYSNHTLKYPVGTPSTVLVQQSNHLQAEKGMAVYFIKLFLLGMLHHSGSAIRQNWASTGLCRMFYNIRFYI